MYPHEDSTYMCIVLSTHMYPLSVQYLSCTPPPPTAPQGTLSTVLVPLQPPRVHYPLYMYPHSPPVYIIQCTCPPPVCVSIMCPPQPPMNIIHLHVPLQPPSVHYPLYMYPHRDRIGTRPSSCWWTTWMPR